ncbi:hypothetical protein TWF730_007276 [Orbilia blumenaviensis]|uniref:C2H2-type domain-containing protein n=1 Tax=Orbilia blumenaviensis TaxID=1796055 RepID=A0AAV9V9M3_9PEZI
MVLFHHHDCMADHPDLPLPSLSPDFGPGSSGTSIQDTYQEVRSALDTRRMTSFFPSLPFQVDGFSANDLFCTERASTPWPDYGCFESTLPDPPFTNFAQLGIHLPSDPDNISTATTRGCKDIVSPDPSKGPLSCLICAKKLANKTTLSDHIKNCHGPKVIIECNFEGCSKKIISAERKGKGNMKRHQQKEHKDWVVGRSLSKRCTVQKLNKEPKPSTD